MNSNQYASLCASSHDQLDNNLIDYDGLVLLLDTDRFAWSTWRHTHRTFKRLNSDTVKNNDSSGNHYHLSYTSFHDQIYNMHNKNKWWFTVTLRETRIVAMIILFTLDFITDDILITYNDGSILILRRAPNSSNNADGKKGIKHSLLDVLIDETSTNPACDFFHFASFSLNSQLHFYQIQVNIIDISPSIVHFYTERNRSGSNDHFFILST